MPLWLDLCLYVTGLNACGFPYHPQMTAPSWVRYDPDLEAARKAHDELLPQPPTKCVPGSRAWSLCDGSVLCAKIMRVSVFLQEPCVHVHNAADSCPARGHTYGWHMHALST